MLIWIRIATWLDKNIGVRGVLGAVGVKILPAVKMGGVPILLVGTSVILYVCTYAGLRLHGPLEFSSLPLSLAVAAGGKYRLLTSHFLHNLRHLHALGRAGEDKVLGLCFPG